jgi:peptide/nickel transport system ATP-binding protein
MTNTILQVDDLRIHVCPGAGNKRSHLLLDACSFTLRRGERLTLVGESGAGKSLLAQAIMGTLPPSLRASGSIHINGVATHGQRSATQALWGSTVMTLPQEPLSALSPLMRVRNQVAEAARYAGGKSWLQARLCADAQLQALGLGHAGSHWLHQLSGGMAQRVGVACLGAAGASLLIADEPTKGLDPAACAQVAALLEALQSDRQTLLTITHDLELAARLGGNLAVMRAGCIVEYGTTQQVLDHPQHAYTRELVAAQPKHWPDYPFAARNGAAPVIQATQLAKRYGARTLFNAVDLQLHAGEVLAISGTSGCGKTTLGNILLGIVPADAGAVHRPLQVPRWKFQKLYQDPPASFSAYLTMQQALDDACKLHRLPTTQRTQWMQTLGLSEALLARKPHEVSGGELQRFALLRAMHLEPCFIFADEPTSRLDPITQRNTMQVLCNATAEQGSAVLLVSHDAALARKCSHRHMKMPEPSD